MKRVYLTDENMKDLDVFLGRVEMKGTEVMNFISIVNALSKATDETVKEDSKDGSQEKR